MIRCTRCCMVNTRPDTPFTDGVCSACISYDKRKTLDWHERENELLTILEKTPRNGSGYDCIVPSSGGKDSHWQVLKLIELGARPLVVTATTCHLTAIGRDNIDNLARYATTIEVSPNKLVRGRLNRLGLTLVGDISWPEHVSIFTTPFRVACDTGIPLILYGENPQEAYGGPKGSEQAKEMTRRWVSEFGGFLGLRPGDMIGQEGITELDMLDYMPPLPKELDKVGVQAYFLGQFYFWDSHENARVAKEHGFKWWDGPPCLGSSWPFENLDNYQTPLHDHMMYRKYGYGRLAAQVSVDVRAGLMSRSHALDMVRMWDGAFPTHSLDLPIHRVLGNIGMTLDDLKPLLERFTDRSLFTEHERDLWPRLLEFV